MESIHLIAIYEFLLGVVGDWYTYVLTGVITLFFIPVVVLILFYAVAVFLYAHKSRRRGHYKDREVWSEHFWNNARLSVCTFINLLAKYWHAKLQLYKKRRLKVVVDHFLFRLPGLKNLLEVFGCFTGPATECVRTLRKGHLLAILPGGVREAIFATDEYDLKWNNRQGFAKVALAARVPIIPVFTTNSRESFKVVKCVQGIFQKVYETTKIPLVLYYGGFPVKMTTYFGPKIEYDPRMTPKEVSDLCADAISKMITEHQRTPGTVLGGLKDRWLPQRMKIL